LALIVKEDFTEPHGENVVIVRIDASTPRLVIPIPGGDAYNEAWLTDGRLVVVDPHGLWVVDAEGTNLHRVFSSPLGRGRLIPAPDGKTVVVTQWHPSGEPDRALIVDLEAGTSRPVCGDEGIVRNRDPQWSPDGTRLPCPVLRNGREAAAVWSTETGTMVVIDPSLSRPIWSPRGDLIAGVDSLSGPDRDLVVMAPDGTGRRTIISASSPFEALVWSPTQTQIAFALRP
jgi:Tol biopolymer transport system component